MNPTEKELTAQLHNHADTDAPPAPVGELIRAGDALRRRRRRLVTIGAAAATAAVVLAVGIPIVMTQGHHDTSPADEPTPVHGQPAVPYLHEGSLHVDGRAIPTNANEVVAAGSTVLVTRFSTTSPTRKWQLLVDGELITVPGLRTALTPMLSPDGRLLAWTSYPDKSTTRITAWDPRTRSEVDHVDLDAPFAECCGGGQLVEIRGVDNTGRIYYGKSSARGPQDYVWRPGEGDPLVLRGAPGIMGVGPLGPVLQRDGAGIFDISGVYGSTDGSGRFHRAGVLPTDQGGAWSADGAWFAYAGDGSGDVTAKAVPKAAWVQRIADRKRIRLRLPGNGRPDDVLAETSTTVLVWVTAGGRTDDIVRCSVADGRCEVALRGVARRGWHFPDRLG